MNKLLEAIAVFSITLDAYKKHLFLVFFLSLVISAILMGFHLPHFASLTPHWSGTYIVGDPIDGGGIHAIHLS